MEDHLLVHLFLKHNFAFFITLFEMKALKKRQSQGFSANFPTGTEPEPTFAEYKTVLSVK